MVLRRRASRARGSAKIDQFPLHFSLFPYPLPFSTPATQARWIGSAYFHSVVPKINAKGGVKFLKKEKLTGRKKETKIQEADVESNILLTATLKMKCCYSNQFVKDWSEILKVRETKAIQFSRRQECLE